MSIGSDVVYILIEINSGHFEPQNIIFSQDLLLSRYKLVCLIGSYCQVPF